MRKLWRGAVAAFVLVSAPAASAQQASEQRVEDILVTGRRSGIPVWSVHGPTTSIVLVGAIDGVTRETKWDPAALVDALRKSDRVMFPGSQEFTASPFAMIGWIAKWKRMANLPKGQTLAQFMRPEQFARLVALQKKGVLKPGFERRHPLHLAMSLRDHARGKSAYAANASAFVEKAAKKYKLKTVPLARRKAKVLATDLFSSRPQEHVPCLMDSVALVEAGPGVVQARSRAWAERRVPDVLRSPAEKPIASCWPATMLEGTLPAAQVQGAVKGLLAQPQVTLAVMELSSLARPGGLLDSLAAAGFDVQGPRWK